MALSSAHASTSLSHFAQNGASNWGLIPGPDLPAYIGGPLYGFNPSAGDFPWGNITAANTNPNTGQPDTGKTRYYDFTIAGCNIAPDGVLVDNQLCINGQFPGPLVQANYGDYIQVTVHNRLEVDEGTTIHWHGLLQKETPWMDGVPSISQCPIPQGNSYTYHFRADSYGTSWYHSHYSAQYSGGVFGPMVIYGPATLGQDIDLGPIMLMDWYHIDYNMGVIDAMSGDTDIPASSNVLINGKMNYNCSQTNLTCHSNAPISKFNFEAGKTHKLRLMNNGAQANQIFSIDDHDLTVIAHDFVPVQPYTVDHLTLAIGQRADVLVNGTGKPGSSYWMRSDMNGSCSLNDGTSTLGLAAIYYNGADTERLPHSTSAHNYNSSLTCNTLPVNITSPVYETAVGPPATTQLFNVTLGFNSSDKIAYRINGIQHMTDYDKSILHQARQGDFDFVTEDAVYNFGSNESVRVIVYTHDAQGHPIHLHGHDMSVLNVGVGEWDGTIVNPNNPMRRDTEWMPASIGDSPGFLVLQWNQDNPGAWPFHCHIAWHLSASFYLTVLERPEEIATNATYAPIDEFTSLTCPAWNRWTQTHRVENIDDGV